MFHQINNKPLQKAARFSRLLFFSISIIVLAFIYLHTSRPEKLVHSSNLNAPQQLRQVADNIGIHVGVTDTDEFRSTLYQNTVPYEFNSITSENLMKFQYIHPCPPVWLINSNETVRTWVEEHGADRPPAFRCTIENAADDEWVWEYLDEVVAWADTHDIGFRGHTFLWYAQNPEWLASYNVHLTVAEREQIMTEHIRTIVSHYCSYDNVYAYDVANEAILSDGSLRPNPWYRIPDYLDKAFRAARDELDQCGRPDIKLYYNEYGIEYGRPDEFANSDGTPSQRPGLAPPNNKTDVVYKYLSDLINRPNPTPIDGVGFQTHLRMYDSFLPHNTKEMVDTMNRFTTGLGLEIAITELDVFIISDNPEALYNEQATQFKGVATACLFAIKCTGFTLWGVHDGGSWVDVERRPLIFYDAFTQAYEPAFQECMPRTGSPKAEYCPKPAYFAIYDALTEVRRSYLPTVSINGSMLISSPPLPANPYPGPGEDGPPISNGYPGP